MGIPSKEKLVQLIRLELEKRIEASEKAVKAAQDSANNESKSSAGDKYETGRAMAQNDRDMYALQLHQAKTDKQFLDNISFEQSHKVIKPGSLVETTMGWFLMAVSMGILEVESTRVMVISLQSPVGMVLNGLHEGHSFDFRGKTFTIISVL